ncbi:LuxR C-terminal-related transcriptional regulator [Pseudomarimonas arenosa]|uniref:HTH luxR-type domain-containing protein n=1 Tax=Pseudomarimonas arenosa TaxID=2774145 RepID=A0AAW3ZJD5_9GAMM|nr:hypothetical protein [Pseudomarimonas arenosa]
MSRGVLRLGSHRDVLQVCQTLEGSQMSTPEVIDRPAARSGKGAALLERGAKQLACTHRITDRELSVLSLLLTDLSLAAIARTLGMGVETVRSHNRSIFLKCGVKSRIALILLVVDMADCTAIA